MATKKVEENNVNKKSSKKSDINKVSEKKSKNVKTKSTVKNKVDKEQNKNMERKKEEKKICSSCGKKYFASLDECPKCGYSKSKNTMYDEVDYEDLEEYDDEEVEVVENKKSNSKSLEKKSSKEEKGKEVSNKKKYVLGKSSFKEQNDDLMDLFKILGIIIVLVLAVYFAIAFMNGEFKKEGENNQDKEITASIQNEKILVSSVFDKTENEYYVLFYDGSDEYWARYYSIIYDSYKSVMEIEKDVLPMFWVDLGDRFNSKYVVGEDGESNPKVKKDYRDLKVKSPTLIRVKKNKAIDYFEDDEVIDTIIDIIKSYEDE